MGNKALAYAGVDFFDALVEYDHLPTLGYVGVNTVGLLRASLLPNTATAGLRDLAVWADTFAQSVRFTFHPDRDLCDVDTYVSVAGREVQVRLTMHPAEVRAVDFGMDVSAGHHCEVSAGRVLRAVAEKAVA